MFLTPHTWTNKLITFDGVYSLQICLREPEDSSKAPGRQIPKEEESGVDGAASKDKGPKKAPN